MTFSSFSSFYVGGFQFFLVYILLFIIKCIFRLTFHPLARFPGPKAAAMTSLYAFSWNLPTETSYVKEFVTWHEKYQSPIVRIDPNHLHIHDIDAYNEIFKARTVFDKDRGLYDNPLVRGSMIGEVTLSKALSHRGLYSQYFSKAAVQKLEPVIQRHLFRFLTKIRDLSACNVSIDLSLGFRCLMADTLMQYCYDKPFGALDAPGFQDTMVMAILDMLDAGPATYWYGGKAFDLFFRFLMHLPRAWIPHQGLAETFRILDGCRARIAELSQRPVDEMAPNVFKTALNPDTQKGQPSLNITELAADGLVLFSAGSDTTATALTFAIYYLIQSPVAYAKLRGEIASAMPKCLDLSDTSNHTFPCSWRDLEELPYLRAVIKESTRKSYGVPGRLPRVVPPEGTMLAGRFIPGGTVVSSASYSYLSNPSYYVDAEKFKPERWFQNDDGAWSANAGVDPEKYFVAFSRGSWSCLGMNLAYAQMYYVLGYMVRNFDITLDSQMKERDMEWHDSFTTATLGHLKVRMARIES